jgi:hypothetical protein
VAHTYNPATQDIEIKRPYLKKTHLQKRAGGVAQEKALSSNTSTERKKEKTVEN